VPANPLVPRQKYGLNEQVCVKKVITAAQVLAMNGAPVQIAAAPGVGYVIMDCVFHVQTIPGSANFASGGVVTFVYHGGSVTPHGSSIPAATIQSGTGSNNWLPPNPATLQPPSNTGIDITNATGAFTTGTGSLVVTMWCTVLKLGA